MFISHWFAELGFTDILAPLSPEKESATKGGASSDVHPEEESAFWSIVAPRSETKPSKPAGGESHSQAQTSNEMGDAQSKPAAPATAVSADEATVHPTGKMVRCRHCHKLTPADGPATANGGARNGGDATENPEEHPTTPLSSLPPKTPANTPALNNESHSAQAATTDDEQSRLQQQVLEACARTALTAAGSTSEWEAKHALFSLCGAPPKPPKKGKDGQPLPPKVGEDGRPVKSKGVKKIDKLLGNQPQLVLCRSAGMASLGLADGCTVLHAACHAGNGEVVEYLLEGWVSLGPVDELDDEEDEEGARPKIDLNERDLQGQTALHVAAGQGHVDVVKMLKEAYEEMAARMDDWDRMMARMIVEDVDGANGEGGEEGDAGSLGGPAGVEELGEKMARLSTSDASTQMTPKTPTAAAPKSKSPMRQRQTPLSRSPKRSPKRPAGRLSPLRSPKFAGPTAPVDLSGTTPLGRAATSPVPKAKKNRGELEKLLYEEGDRSIVGAGRTPPRERCGPRGRVSPVPSGGGAAAPTIGGTSRYLSPTPGKRRGRRATPGSAASSKYATPFGTPPTILEGEPLAGDGNDNPQLPLRFGAAEMNGWRIEMEDKILARYPLYEAGVGLPTRPEAENADAASAAPPLGPTLGLFGVFDGHGDGGYASEFIATRLEMALKSQSAWAAAYYGCNTGEGNGPLESVLTQACYDLDEELRTDRARPRDGGTTAIVAVVSDRDVFVANVGDSRCILVRRKEAATGEAAAKKCLEPSELDVVPMSEDHKPDLPEERSRIESAGLTVQTDHVPPAADDEDGEFTAVHRVRLSDKELLGVSRAFGDHDYKSNSELSASRQAVVCTPDILIRERDDSLDMYLVLACDGIWDVMSNDEAGAFVARRAAERLGDEADDAVEGEVLARVGDDLLAECLRKGSRDNMSVLIVALPASGIAGAAQTSSNASAGQNEATDGTVRALEYE